MKNLDFIVTEDVIKLGVKIITARVSGIKNIKNTPELDLYINSELEKIKAKWEGESFKENPILLGFRELHAKVGRSNRDYPSSPEVLIRMLLEKGRYPRINCVVDIYNLFSLKTQLALGAHDINFINGNVTLRLTKGDEKFQPLGSSENVKVLPGEYSYIDDENNIICRLEVLQVEPTKITLGSQDIFLIIQGNSKTTKSYIKDTTDELLEVLIRFCGGKATLLNSLS
jgi:DNA/RNA-binding domain of Phe-tRNA-synthetase-like protein